MTHAATQPDTKHKIIEAAYKVLGEQGYDKASMKEIAKEAGVAQGLINYYFPSKEELLFELFREETVRYCLAMRELDSLPLGPDFILDALRISFGIVDAHPEWLRLRYELFAIGTRTEAGLKEIADNMKSAREVTIQTMNRIKVGEHVDKSALASILTAVLDGISLQKMSDPGFDAEAVYKELAAMLASHVGRG